MSAQNLKAWSGLILTLTELKQENAWKIIYKSVLNCVKFKQDSTESVRINTFEKY